MKATLLTGVLACCTLAVNAGGPGGRAGDMTQKSGSGGPGGPGGGSKSGDAVSGPAGGGGAIGGNIRSSTGRGGDAGRVESNIGPVNKAPTVVYGSVTGNLGDNFGGGKANGGSSGSSNPIADYRGAQTKGGASNAETGDSEGGKGARGGDSGNQIKGSKTGGGGKGGDSSVDFSPQIPMPPLRRSLDTILRVRRVPYKGAQKNAFTKSVGSSDSSIHREGGYFAQDISHLETKATKHPDISPTQGAGNAREGFHSGSERKSNRLGAQRLKLNGEAFNYLHSLPDHHSLIPRRIVSALQRRKGGPAPKPGQKQAAPQGKSNSPKINEKGQLTLPAILSAIQKKQKLPDKLEAAFEATDLAKKYTPPNRSPADPAIANHDCTFAINTMQSGKIPMEIIAALEDPKNGWVKKEGGKGGGRKDGKNEEGSGRKDIGEGVGGKSAVGKGTAGKGVMAKGNNGDSGLVNRRMRRKRRSVDVDDYLEGIYAREAEAEEEEGLWLREAGAEVDAESEPDFSFEVEEFWSRNAEADAEAYPEAEADAEPEADPEAEPEALLSEPGDYVMDYALYKREPEPEAEAEAEAEPEWLVEADFALVPREADAYAEYDDDLEMVLARDGGAAEIELFNLFSREKR